ncbi:hypothetical protein VTJ04DRAFT_10646 [Mycothermus thermophilus]|uniref:uncharacterized protein n=1 Tax=Humicola insolens TaxID=85995 RepID=UPI0037435424
MGNMGTGSKDLASPLFSVRESCGCIGAHSVIQHHGQGPFVIRNLGCLCLSCRCFCNQNMGRSTTDTQDAFVVCAVCHFNLACVFPLFLFQ